MRPEGFRGFFGSERLDNNKTYQLCWKQILSNREGLIKTSYEGYYQAICENGHYWTEDCWAYYHEGDKKYGVCPTCDGKIIWTNVVDVTNGSFDNEGNQIDGYKTPILVSEKKCEHCNSIIEQLYKPPEGDGYGNR